MPGTAGRIRDPIHGYIAATAVERALFDHPVAQRLRHVSQSAASHLVFPAMRVSRFAHSLGAMHLASRFLTSALRNAGDAERAQVIAACHALAERHGGAGLGAAEAAVTGESALLAGRELAPSDRAAVLLAEQGLRLASLVHDLGHLPFSHDFELALDARLREDPALRARLAPLHAPGVRGEALHEKVGYALAAAVQERAFAQAPEGTGAAGVARIAFPIARAILDAPAAPELEADATARVLSWLHSLIAGEVDVDRADYVLRDVQAYGLSAAVYDVDRLVESLAPVALPGGALATAILPTGVSDAEAFFVARFRMYVWAIYHHKIQQAAAGLRVAIEDALAHPGVDVLLDAITAIATGAATDAVLLDFAECDDVWFTELMRARLRAGPPPEVVPWSALFLRRRPGPVSLWKRPADFPAADRAAWNARLPGRDDLVLQRTWHGLARGLRAEGLLVHRLPFRPWEPGPDGQSRLQVLTPGGLRPLTAMAPLVRGLAAAWADALQVHVYAARPGLAEPAAVLQRLEPALRDPQEQP